MSSKTDELLDTFRGLIAQYGIILDIDREVATLLDWPIISLDVEHDELGNMVGIGVCHENSCLYFTHCTLELSNYLLRRSIIAHNGISDLECLRIWGIPINDSQLIWDTFLMGHIIDSSHRKYGLKDMAARELAIEYPSYDDIVGKRTLKQKHERQTLDKQPVELVAMYNAMDCFVTYKLMEYQTTTFKLHKNSISTDEEIYFNNIEKPISQIFNAMSNRGIKVDLSYLTELKTVLEAQSKPILADILNELGNINVSSPKQLLEALHEKGLSPVLKGKPSTDKRALAQLPPNPIVSNLLHYSELDTLLTTFVKPYLERAQEIVHPFFNQCGTRTGRLSCSNPNLLQIPRRTENGKLVRKMFIPRAGMVMGDCDYSAIEPRVLAHLSKDPNLCQLFTDGTDFHQFTANKLGIDRDRAKILNLSVGYRATFKSVSAQLKCTDSEAQNEINNWWTLFPHLRRWQDRLIYDSKRSGFCTTLLGRRIRVDDLENNNRWKREAAERQLINNITQGSAAEIMKMAMIGINSVAPQLGLLVQIYDELLFESSAIEGDMDIVQHQMKTAVILDVPLAIESGTGMSWAACK